MKTLSDGIQVKSNIYYYLLDFNESDNWEFIRTNFNKYKLHELTITEFTQLFQYVTNKDIEYLQSKFA